MATRRALTSSLLRKLPQSLAPAPARLLHTPAVQRAPLRSHAKQFMPVGRRAYSQAAGSKIWNFEEIKKLSEEADPKVIIVDTREPSELKSTGHIPHAVNIPITSAADSFHISDEEFEDRFGYPRPPKDREVVFYCKAGVRSRAAAGLAREAGWTKVGEYPGSWLDWEGKGGKIER